MRVENAMGWFDGDKGYCLQFYDRVRLAQDLESESVFFEPNLIVIRAVTRQNMEHAVEPLIQSGRIDELVAE